MKRYVSILLAVVLMCVYMGGACTSAEEITLPDLYTPDMEYTFDGIDDPMLLRYIEDSVYANLEEELYDTAYTIDEISAIYISKEYLEEINYNMQANIFFGYTLKDITDVFGTQKYIFTCDQDGVTQVTEFYEIPDDTYDRIIKNVLIGTGVIAVCVVVSVATAGIGAPAAITATASTATKISMIFTASATKATELALSGALMGSATTAVVKGIQTGDVYETFSAAAVAGSESFKWGAISGAAVGGISEGIRIHRVTGGEIPSWREAEKKALIKYPGYDQMSYLDGKKVPWGTSSSTRPDIVFDNVAYEIKHYDLASKANLSNLKSVLTKEVTDRVANLPSGMKQAIILNVEGRGYTQVYVESVVEWIQDFLDPIYPDIPIEIIGGML